MNNKETERYLCHQMENTHPVIQSTRVTRIRYANFDGT